jgi:hypothetical protein
MIANKRISTKSLSKNFKSTKAPVQFLPLENNQRNRPEPTRKIPCPQPMVCTMDDSEPQPRRHRLPVAIRPSITVRFTLKSVRWIIVVLFLYLVIGTVMMIEDGTDAMRTIIVYSVMGFATFFMAYFGWIVARDVLEQISRHREAAEDPIPEAQ